MPVDVPEICTNGGPGSDICPKWESAQQNHDARIAIDRSMRDVPSSTSKKDVTTHDGVESSSQCIHSGSYGMSRSLRSLLKKTSEFVYVPKRPFPGLHAGPLTYGQSLKEVVGSLITSDFVSRNLSSLCEAMKRGLLLQRISRRKQVIYLFKLVNDEAITWKDGSKHLELDSIKDIRIGNMASNYREEYGVSEKVSRLWITIIYAVSNKLKALHVVAKDENDFHIFSNCICGLVYSRRELMESISVPDNEKFANIHWHTSVSDRKEDEMKDTLTFEDVRKLCDKFHIYCSVNHLQRLFFIADVNHNGLLNFQEFQTFVKLLKNRPEVNQIWKTLANEKNVLDFSDFFRFLKDIQDEDVKTQDAHALFDRFCAPNKDVLYEEDFLKFLGAQSHSKELVEDYTKPLNHYYIASSHNTYLLGKQVGESCSVEGYVQALQQGCRCIEIDVWDDDMGPVVCHGFLTGSIPLVNVVEIIRKYAFITSPYPLIVSLEINCNKENQLITRAIFQNSLGSMLFQSHWEESDILPSPKDLMHKIILKGKKSGHISSNKLNSDSSTFGDTTSSYSSSVDSEVETSSKSKEVKSTTRMRRMRRLTISKHIEVGESILGICGLFGLKFRNFSLPESKTSNHCFSFNERKFDSLCKDKAQKLSLDKHNRRHLMRVYPHALRYKSTNFNPIKYWVMGAQMVATNWQTYDLGQQINLAMFQLSNQKNGILYTGYVLKPPSLVPKVSKVQELPLLYKRLREPSVNVYLRILSAQLLPKPVEVQNNKEPFAPYVTVEFIMDEEPAEPLAVLHGLKVSENAVSTSYCKDNGFNPTWDTEVSLAIKSKSFAFVKFTVKTDQIALATSCFKLAYMKTGYRHIPLYSMDGELYIFSTIFIYLKVQ